MESFLPVLFVPSFSEKPSASFQNTTFLLVLDENFEASIALFLQFWDFYSLLSL